MPRPVCASTCSSQCSHEGYKQTICQNDRPTYPSTRATVDGQCQVGPVVIHRRIRPPAKSLGLEPGITRPAELAWPVDVQLIGLTSLLAVATYLGAYGVIDAGPSPSNRETFHLPLPRRPRPLPPGGGGKGGKPRPRPRPTATAGTRAGGTTASTPAGGTTAAGTAADFASSL